MIRTPLHRRALLGASTAGLGLLVSGCDSVLSARPTRSVLKLGQAMSMGVQRAIMSAQPLAREFQPNERSPIFKVNGTSDPQTDEYRALQAANFSNYRLSVEGLVHAPRSFSLDDLKTILPRNQITRHDCVEGWSAIGKWTGAPLHEVLIQCAPDQSARFVVFECFDPKPGAGGRQTPYYESIDLFDAYHPQTPLAYALNDEPLSVGHGAPLRLRVERQLGYKQAKFIKRIVLASSLAGIYGGNGGYWEDVAGYEWYGGI